MIARGLVSLENILILQQDIFIKKYTRVWELVDIKFKEIFF